MVQTKAGLAGNGCGHWQAACQRCGSPANTTARLDLDRPPRPGVSRYQAGRFCTGCAEVLADLFSETHKPAR